MKRTLSSQAGMSLVEATIILMVLALLTAVIAPSAADYIEDARNTKAKEDVEALGTGLARLLRDTGLPCVSLNGSTCALAGPTKAELMLSGTSTTANLPDVDVADVTGITASTTSAATLNWAGQAVNGNTVTAVVNGRRTLADSQLVSNSVSYTLPSFAAGAGRGGWRGAYISGPVGLDPWGKAYEANVVFLGIASDSAAGTSEGQLSGGWNRDVLVLSAGPNTSVETSFGALAASAAGDDIIYVVQGSTK